MGKPRLIILIRHGQSEGNKNREIHQSVPDHRVQLTPEGQRQALEAGRRLRTLLRPDDRLHFFISPYRRTRETTEGILSTLTSDDPEPSPFPRRTIKVDEEPRIREQDFGNFQPNSAEMTRMWHERASYGHFFYRIPNGESAADVYDRVAGFNETLFRKFGDKHFASVCVLVTHGLMTRIFLMKWFAWSVEYFEDLRNINHCEFIVMARSPDSGKFILRNQLRTWTQYKKDLAAERGEAQGTSQQEEDSIPRKRWNQSETADPPAASPQRQKTADLLSTDQSQAPTVGDIVESDDKSQGPTVLRDVAWLAGGSKEIQHLANDKAIDPETGRKVSLKKSDLLSPNTIVILRAGRDGGGSLSGQASSSEESEAEDEDTENTPRVSTRSFDTPADAERGQQLRELRGSLSESLHEQESSDRRQRTGKFQASHGTDDISGQQPHGGSLGNMHALADVLGNRSDDADLDEMVGEKKREERSFANSVR